MLPIYLLPALDDRVRPKKAKASKKKATSGSGSARSSKTKSKKEPANKKSKTEPHREQDCRNERYCDRCHGSSASPLFVEVPRHPHPCCGEGVCITRSNESIDIRDLARPEATNQTRRYQVYRRTDRWLHGLGRAEQARPLPRCVLVLTRRVWPSGHYTGYRG